MDSSEYIVQYRKERNLSQRQFSKLHDVPLSTLRKWEQKESTPSKFFVEMIKLKDNKNNLITFRNENKIYLFDSYKKIVYDNLGSCISVDYDLTSINKNNLFIILDQLFEDYYKMMEVFKIQCILDKKENGDWKVLK